MGDTVPEKRPRSPPRRQRACFNCSTAKARCNFKDENIGKYCDRCHRIGVECVAQTTKSLRRPRKLTGTVSRASPLGRSIDGIVSLLGSNHIPGPQESAQNFGAVTTTGPTSSSAQALQSTSTPELSSQGRSFQSSISSQASRVSSSSAGHSQVLLRPHFQKQEQQQRQDNSGIQGPSPQPGYGLTWHLANDALENFRTNFVPNFPFVVVSLDLTAQELHTKKPFLFRAIMFVAADLPPTRHKALKRGILAYLGHRLLVNGERDLDLLQGLLVFIAWADLSFYMDKQITHLIYLAMGYACNLGLTRMPCTSTENATDASQSIWCQAKRRVPTMQKTHDVDEQRAFLGCYYLQSVNSVQFRRSNRFKSPYIDACCKLLAQLNMAPTDGILDRLIRLQEVVDTINERHRGRQFADRSHSFEDYTAHEIRALRVELDEILEGIERSQPLFSSVWLHYNYALIKLYESATYLHDRSGDTISHISHCLHYCLQAVTSFFAAMISFPARSLLHRPFVTFAELISAIVAASKLLLLKAEGWSVEEARQILDLPGVLGALIAQFETVNTLEKQRRQSHQQSVSGADRDKTGAADEGTVWEEYIEKLSVIKMWYETNAGTSGPVYPTKVVSEGHPEDHWALLEGTGDQFWLGLLGNDL
ncbi:hypothetical protein VM1G_08403 [Cytospora mali]|uniref:Zn(2)-C6 fungal-type domain-containing protein n=1 Tax=Cytospora mali TaxID=578113 RepID=A0A194W8W9_CYTMA|nr:hypothetical protein VM1G_08403 [Valsa mali]